MDRATFVDETRIHVAAGDGGSGCVSFLREKYRPKGKPNGGNGGNGGSIIMRVEPNIATLAELSRNPHQRAEAGRNGSGNDRHGANGEDKVLLVPDGTVIRDESGTVLADLVGAGAEFVVAKGGKGGRGNASLVTPKRRAPGFAERGEPGEQLWLSLELKVLADVGLVGFPNAGKSSLIARLSAARPKVAAYPFTTLTPNLGVAEAGGARFVVADVPGLIEGASEGRGLGLSFLRHLERCRVLCFVLDVAADPPGEALTALRQELRAHLPAFDERSGVVAANKIDLPGTEAAVAEARSAAEAEGFRFVAVSAETGEGVESLSELLATTVREAEEAEPPRMSHRLIRIRPEEQTVRIEREDDGAWRVHSAAAERLLRRFDIHNIDALGFIQERLLAMGVEDALSRAGAKAGDDVRIGDLELEFTPEREAGEGRGR